MNLVIVESPTKAKTISRFLGKNFQVESSYGHVRDLPKGDLGIDTEKNFEPRYIIPKKSQKNVNNLKKLAKESEKIILATDEDREGEAIAWHLVQALGLNDLKSIERIVFHEITKKAIEEALKKPRAINEDLVNAQQARRILDRLVGYKLSPFLWKKLMRGLSAGRVQSVALRLILDRENEIRNFIVQNYWTIKALLQNKKKEEWESELAKINGVATPKPGLTNETEVQKIIKELESASWKIESVEKKEKEQQPRPPFTTSTLQQAAWQRLKFSAKKTMVVAQQLYETGFITYMRTDSLNMSEEALKSAAKFLKKNYGEKYSLAQPRRFKTKNKGAQEAHEAIRPADPEILPESIKKKLSPDQYKLYNLIWKRFTATQMPNAIFDNTTADITAMGSENKYSFQSKGVILKFDGFLKIYEMNIEEKILPNLDKKDAVAAKEIKPEKHQTQPPARYNDASLVKALEKHGIGRPSTYAQIISTIQERNYIEKDEAKRFVPTEIGEKVNKMLVENFPQIVDINFTAEIENDLDKIAAGEAEYARIVKNFYGPFEKNLEEKYQSVEKENLTEETKEICDKCGKPMVIKHGRFGRFIACSGFPECKNTKHLPAKQLGIKCPLCKNGDVIERKTKRGRMFYGCSVWPKCEFAAWQKPTGELCPECQSPLIELKNGIKCSSKSCRFTKN